ncbi:MAG: transglutaminaseTgpA domain-containing protein [Candidatus Dormibacteria bacterium]
MRRLTRGARLPEDRLNARAAVFAAAAVANLAMAITAGVLLTSLACLGVIAIGHAVSWRGRHRPRTARGQAVLGLLILLCVAYLVADLTVGVFGGALPQAKFAVLAQAVTSFDLKSRRNLFTHLWHSAVVLYVGSLFAWNPTFLVFVLGWAGALFAFMYFTRREGSVGPRPRLARWTTAWLAMSGLIFLAIPHFAGRPIAVPLLVSIPLTDTSGAETLPSVLPLVGSAPGPNSDPAINLRVRGRLGDEVMFRVRSPAPGYWRAYTLSTYRGQSWSRRSGRAQPIQPIATHLQVTDEGPATGSLPQSYFIERPLPAEILVAYPVTELYFPARGAVLVDTGTVHSPVPLRRGVNYSAVSAVRDLGPDRLRRVMPIDALVDQEDLRLPASVPARVSALAEQLTAGTSNEYDSVRAITAYLRAHYRYSLDTPRLPAGVDAVDQFLFIDRVGYCEQFASALTVMLRSRGIPSRMAVGYSTGDQDQLTGSFTVRARDAHAWVEVLFPGVGWVPFDASPGFATLPANRMPQRWFLSDFAPQLAFAGLGSAPRAAVVTSAAALGLVLLMVLVGLAWRRSRLLGRSPQLRAYRRAQRWLGLARLSVRAGPETPSEHLQRLKAGAPEVALALAPLVEALHLTAFAGRDAPRRGSIAVLRAALRWRVRGRGGATA